MTDLPPPPQDPPTRPLPQADERIDLNTATASELQRLDGIGEKRAQTILEDREQNGPFRSVDDLDRVKGFGMVTVDKLRPFLTAVDPGAQPPAIPAPESAIVTAPLGPSPTGAAMSRTDSHPEGPPADAESAPASFPYPAWPTPAPSSAGSPPNSPAASVARININTAGVEELKTLKDIGDVLAGRIIAYRTTFGPFRRPEDLMKVKGIGTKTLEKNRHLITVE